MPPTATTGPLYRPPTLRQHCTDNAPQRPCTVPSAPAQPRLFDKKRQQHAKSQTTTMQNNNTTVPVLVLLVVSLTAIANTGFWGSEVLRKLRRQSAQHPQRQRNQREHQRHLPFPMPLTALPFRFGLHPQYPHSTTLPYPRSLYLTTNISLLCLQ